MSLEQEFQKRAWQRIQRRVLLSREIREAHKSSSLFFSAFLPTTQGVALTNASGFIGLRDSLTLDNTLFDEEVLLPSKEYDTLECCVPVLCCACDAVELKRPYRLKDFVDCVVKPIDGTAQAKAELIEQRARAFIDELKSFYLERLVAGDSVLLREAAKEYALDWYCVWQAAHFLLARDFERSGALCGEGSATVNVAAWKKQVMKGVPCPTGHSISR